MKKIAILGCENTHAKAFLEILAKGGYDAEVVGVYSADVNASQALADKFGVGIMDNYDSLVGKVDGVMITARDGKYHFQYALPYIGTGATMFIDKPFCITDGQAEEFAKLLKDNNVAVCGGSSLKFDYNVNQLRQARLDNVGGKTLGGYVVEPYDPTSAHSGFHFYAQHLIETVTAIFGDCPDTVSAFDNNGNITVVFGYGDYNVTGLFTSHVYNYFACRVSESGTTGYTLQSTDEHPWFVPEFDEFYNLLIGKTSTESYAKLTYPVSVMNAVLASLKSGKTEKVEKLSI